MWERSWRDDFFRKITYRTLEVIQYFFLEYYSKKYPRLAKFHLHWIVESSFQLYGLTLENTQTNK